MYYVYILRCEDHSLYTGITNDVHKRFEQHVLGKGARYTKSHKVKSIEIIISTLSKSDALKLEYKIKKLTKSNKEKLILLNQDIMEDLGIDKTNVEKSN